MTTSLELLCSELIVCKKKWIIFSVYRPPDSNLDGFFANLSVSLNQALDRYDNVIVMGDINIDTQDSQHLKYNKLASFCDVFGLSNLVTTKTCLTNSHSSSIDVILTNKLRSFLKTSLFETGLSDCHGLVMTFMKAVVARLKPKIIRYRSYKRFDPKKFLQGVKKPLLNTIWIILIKPTTT